MSDSKRPQGLTPKLDEIPPELKTLKQWVNWRYEGRGAKWTKVPFQPNGRPAATNDPATWASFDETTGAFRAGEFDGIGFVFSKTDDFAGCDLDHVRDSTSGELSLRASEIIAELDSYTEVSPSGTGIHIICRGKLPPGRRRRDWIELYDKGRFFCFTGHHVAGTPDDIQDRDFVLSQFHKGIFGAVAQTLDPAAEADAGDTEPLARARTVASGERFSDLYDRGNWRPYYSSQSEADLALCGMLRAQCGPHASQIDRLFRSSKLMRKKWDDRHGAQTYGEITIAKALSNSSRKPTSQGSKPSAADIGTQILTGDHFAQDPAGKVYVYSGGVYIRGEEHIRRRVKDSVPGRYWSSYVANEVIEYIRVGAPGLWDRPPLDTLNVLNGLLDINTRQLREHSPSYLSPIQLPVKFDPRAACPAWEKQIRATFPSDAVEVGLGFQIVAFLMLPITSIQKAILLLGQGGTGKSTFLMAVLAFLGRSNASSVPLHKLENERFAPGRLVGKLVNVCADLPSTQLTTSSVFKQITGGDAIVGEHKFKDSFDFVPFVRLLFSANHPPRSADASSAFFDRWYVIEFPYKYRGTPEEVDRATLDTELSDPRELSGVLNRALDMLPEVLRRGLSVTPDMRRAATEFRSVTDPLAVWLDAHTLESPRASISRDNLFNVYCAYATDNGLPCPTKHAFGTALKAHRPNIRERQRTVAGRERTWCWVGIGLRSDVGDSLDATAAS